MTHRRYTLAVALTATAVFAAPARSDSEHFTLARAVPDDVLLYAAGRHNPESEFIYGYWSEVFQAAKNSGIGDDILELLGSALSDEGMAEVQRLKQRALDLIDAVDWDQLGRGETVFAERLTPPVQTGSDVFMPPPNMVCLIKGDGQGIAKNFDGLSAILQAVVEEINRAADAEALQVERTTLHGAQVATVDLLSMLPGAPALPLTVAKRENLLMVAFGEDLFKDVLALLDGSGTKRPIADDPRFKDAFAQLPPPEDAMVFFNMQAMLKPMLQLTEKVVAAVGAPGDEFLNTSMTSEVGQLHRQSLAAYRQKDYPEALRLTREAYEHDQDNSILLYNLACFSALTGQSNEALDWLEKAVKGGFYAPTKIESDSDLDSLRHEARYEAALAEAREMAAKMNVGDVVINSSRTGEAYKLSMQAWQVYKQEDYEQGLRLVEQAYQAAPTDSRVLYYLACFHCLVGHKEQALNFLEKAVAAGFYCPNHISKDPDLDAIRSSPRFAEALNQARTKAASMGAKKEGEKLTLAKTIFDRLMNAVGILDYSATVESTEGYSSHAHTLTVLVQDAASRPIYKVFGHRQPLKQFDRFLPVETQSFSVCNGIDVEALYDYIEQTLADAGPIGNELLGHWTELQGQIGIDVRKDLLSWMQGESISVTLAQQGGSVMMLKVTDSDAARESVKRLFDLITAALQNAAGQNPALAMLGMQRSPLQHPRLEGFENLQFAFAPVPMVWGVADEYLIFGSSLDAVLLCLDTAAGDHPSIRENPQAMAEMIVPAGPFSSVSLSDLRNLGQELAMGIGIASSITTMMTMGIPDEKARAVIARISGMIGKLVPVVSKIDFYKSSSTHMTFDGKAWRYHMVTHYLSPAERDQRAQPPAATKAKATEGL